MLWPVENRLFGCLESPKKSKLLRTIFLWDEVLRTKIPGDEVFNSLLAGDEVAKVILEKMYAFFFSPLYVLLFLS